jgi:hypothetical protein
MQAIRPQHLTDEEVLRQVYLMGNEMLPKEWVEELCRRLANAIDHPEEVEAECDGDCGQWQYGYDEGYEDGKGDAENEQYEKGFTAGVAAANQ